MIEHGSQIRLLHDCDLLKRYAMIFTESRREQFERAQLPISVEQAASKEDVVIVEGAEPFAISWSRSSFAIFRLPQKGCAISMDTTAPSTAAVAGVISRGLRVGACRIADHL
jgi:hypothetical protein